MTDRRAQMQRSKRRTALAVYAITALLFATRRRGSSARAWRRARTRRSAPARRRSPRSQPRKVLVRKVVVTKRIVVVKPAPPSAAARGVRRRRRRRPAPRRPTSRPRRRAPAPAAPRPRRPPRRSPPPPPERDSQETSQDSQSTHSEPAGRPGHHDEPAHAPRAVDRAFPLMGTHMRSSIGRRSGAPGARRPRQDAADRVVALLEDYDGRLSRFRPDSELSAAERRPADDRPRLAAPARRVRVALWTARRARTASSTRPSSTTSRPPATPRAWKPERRLDLRAALDGDRPAPHRGRGARAAAAGATSSIDDDAGTITRPAGLRLDTGGSGKGHAAELRRPSCSPATTPGPWTAAATCASAATPASCATSRSSTPSPARRSTRSRSATARSPRPGLRSRIWRGRGRRRPPPPARPVDRRARVHRPRRRHRARPEHRRGRGAREGRAARAAPTARGPRSPAHGGITVAEDGAVERIGRLAPAPRVRLRLPAPRPTP